MTWPLLLGRQIAEAMHEVSIWGYPRPLEEDDQEALWTSPCEGFYVWVERVGDVGVLHSAIAPEKQRRVYAGPFLSGLSEIAAALRLTHLLVLSDSEFTVPDKVKDYLLRMGFREHEKGYVWERPQRSSLT